MNCDACDTFKTALVTSSDALDEARRILAKYPVEVNLDWINDDTDYHIEVIANSGDFDLIEYAHILNEMKENGFSFLDSDEGTIWFD